MTTQNRTRIGWVRRGAAALFGLLMLLASMVVSTGTAQAAPALPGGKQNWVVSVGGLDLSFDNWVRLGYYEFSTDGTVKSSFWYWHQKSQPMREDAMETNCGGEVPGCSLRTVEGFSGTPDGTYTGTFGYTADNRLAVTWTGGSVSGQALDKRLTEYWNVESGLASGGVARITSPTYYGQTTAVTMPGENNPFSDYSATFGIGYGSNFGLDSGSRVSMDELLSNPLYNSQVYKGAYVRTNVGTVGREGSGGDWTFSRVNGNNNNPWRKCRSGPCMGFLQEGAGTCRKAWADNTAPATRVRYIGEVGGGRRNTEEYWCQGLAGRPAEGKCYEYNSHPRPMLQVIDDSGRFQGWVGVEAFTHVSTDGTPPNGQADSEWKSGYFGVFDMVSVPALKPTLVKPVTPPKTTAFQVAHGASVATGTLTWLNRSVGFELDNKVVSGCRKVLLKATGADGSTQDFSSSPLCTATTRPFDNIFDFSDVAGGATKVEVTYVASDDGVSPYVPKDADLCTRSGCVNVPVAVDADRDVTDFKLTYGASVAAGELTWANRSVSFELNNYVSSGCRKVFLTATGADGSTQQRSTSPLCTNTTRPFAGIFSFSAVEGGAAKVELTHWISEDGGLTYATKETATCSRNGCTTAFTHNPETGFRVANGASVAAGSLTWLNRSVTFDLVNHAASGCRFVELAAYAGTNRVAERTSSRLCINTDPGNNRAFAGTLPVDVPGGATRVDITYYAAADQASTYTSVDSTVCTRSGCV